MGLLSGIKSIFSGVARPPKPTTPYVMPPERRDRFSGPATNLNTPPGPVPIGPSMNALGPSANLAGVRSVANPIPGNLNVGTGPAGSGSAAMAGMSLDQMRQHNAARPAVPLTTSQGQQINPATGGITAPQQTLTSSPAIPTDLGFHAELDPNDPAAIGGAMMNQNAPANPAAPVVPDTSTPDAVTAAEKAYQASLGYTPEQEAAQAQMDALEQSYNESSINLGNQAIPLGFITGQQAHLERRALALAEPLERRMARLEAKRTAGIAQSKFALERADKAAEVKESEKEEGFTLGENQQRFDASGKLIATGPAKAAGGDSNKVLSVAEAQTLGVPYGTTEAQAIAMGKTPEKPLTVDESKTRQFATAATDANAILDASTYNVGNVENPYLPNAFKSPERQQFETAARAFVNAVLRRESGATITDDEFKNKYRELIPVAGNDPATKEQKKKARSSAVASMRESGKLDQGGGSDLDSALDAAGFSRAGSGASNAQVTNVKIGNQTVKVSGTVGQKLAAADRDFFAATGQHIKVNEAYRTRERQAELYAQSQAGKIGRAAPPGKSFHETGNAIDVANWKAAEKYLRKYGLVNDLADDRNHFSFGETNTA